MKKQIKEKRPYAIIIIVFSVLIIATNSSCKKETYSQPCYPPYPTGLFADSITSNSAKLHVSLNFTLPGKQVFVGFNYKSANSSTWNLSANVDPVRVYNLLPGTRYEYYATSKCTDQNGTGYRSSLVHAYFTTRGCNCVRPIPVGCAAACGF